MGILLSFAGAPSAKRRGEQAARRIKNRNDDLIARYRPKTVPTPVFVDPTHDVRAIAEYQEPTLKLVSYMTEDDLPPPRVS